MTAMRLICFKVHPRACGDTARLAILFNGLSDGKIDQ